MKKERKPKTTLQTYKALKRTKLAMQIGTFVLPLVPMVVIGGINWNDWFANAGSSLPAGFTTMLIATLSAIATIVKNKELKEHGISPLIIGAITLILIGVSCKFLSSILNDLGTMFIAAGAGIVMSFVDETVEHKIVDGRIEEYAGYVRDNNLDPKQIRREEKRKAREEKAKKEAEELKAKYEKEREKVDIL